MKLSYLLLFGLLAFIVSRMSNAYTNMAKELRELRIKCMGDNAPDTRTASDVALPIVDDMKRVSNMLQGIANKF